MDTDETQIPLAKTWGDGRDTLLRVRFQNGRAATRARGAAYHLQSGGATGGNRTGLVRGNEMLWRQTPANVTEKEKKYGSPLPMICELKNERKTMNDTLTLFRRWGRRSWN